MIPALRPLIDRFNPVLVKELRQGLRSRVFVIAFFTLQVVLFATMLANLLQRMDQSASDSMGTMFWTMLGIPLVFMLPLSGYGMLSGELKANTLELMFLTRLSAFRIVLGKWLAIVLQVLLLMTSVLPYVALRYFLGGVNVVGELLGACMLLLVSAGLAAIAVGLSPVRTRFLRILIMLGAVLGGWMLVGVALAGMLAMTSGMGGMPFSFGLELAAPVAFVLSVGVVVFFMLETGAAAIAPDSENHPAILRVVATTVTFLGFALSYWSPAFFSISVLGIMLLSLVSLRGFGEEVRTIPRIYVPFVKRGLAGRMIGRLLYPGWPSALRWSIVCAIGCAVASYVPMQMVGIIPDRDVLLSLLYGATALIFPAALTRLIPGVRDSRAISFYFGLQVVTVFLNWLGWALEAVMRSVPIQGIFAIWPGCAMLTAMREGDWDWVGPNPWPAAGWAIGLILLSLLILHWRARPSWRTIRAMEREAATLRMPGDRKTPAESPTVETPAAPTP